MLCKDWLCLKTPSPNAIWRGSLKGSRASHQRARYLSSVMASDRNLRALQLGCHAINFDKLDLLDDHVGSEG